jgi:hypothetical protein
VHDSAAGGLTARVRVLLCVRAQIHKVDTAVAYKQTDVEEDV